MLLHPAMKQNQASGESLIMIDLYKLKKDLAARNIFLSFSGPLSQDLMVEMCDALKQKMSMEDAEKSTVLRVFSMFVENAQNIIHYSAEKSPPRMNSNDDTGSGKPPLSQGIITVGYEAGHYFIFCGNLMENTRVDRLREKLNRLKKMNKDELKAYYKQKRKQKPGEDSKGGGLGFIEIARKSSEPIAFDFVKVNDVHSFFSIKTTI